MLFNAPHNAGFSAICGTGRVQQATYPAHTRHKFHDLHVVHPTAFTIYVLRRIGELHEIEKPLRDASQDIRRQVRQARTRPLLVDFAAWLRAPVVPIDQV
ncbi:MAG: transposase [Bradyrhizobium sp.]|jgi:transposase